MLDHIKIVMSNCQLRWIELLSSKKQKKKKIYIYIYIYDVGEKQKVN